VETFTCSTGGKINKKKTYGLYLSRGIRRSVWAKLLHFVVGRVLDLCNGYREHWLEGEVEH